MKKCTCLIPIITCLALSLLIAGCTERPAKQALTMYTYLDRSDKAASDKWDVLIEAFKKLHPEIELQIEYGFGMQYTNRINVLASANLLPDLLFLWSDKRSNGITGSGKMADLRKYLSGLENSLPPRAREGQGPNGEIWVLPEQVRITHVMYTNNKLLKNMRLSFPKTLSGLLGQGDKIRANGLIPVAMDNKEGWQVPSSLLSMLVARTGGEAWLTEAASGTAKFTDPEFVTALGAIKTLSNARMFSPAINAASYGTALSDFVNEKAVYLIDGGWRIHELASRLTAQQKEYVSLELFPAIQGEKLQGVTSIESDTGYGIKADIAKEKADAAWKWIWFYCGPVGSAIRLEKGAIPACKVEAADADPMVRKLLDLTGRVYGGYPLDTVMDGAGLGISLGPAIQKMIEGKKTPEAVAKDYESWVSANDSGRKKPR